MPYFYKCKVITSYVEILINEQKYQKALEIIVKNHLEKFMPLCMFNYKNNNTYIFNNVDSSPYYTLLCILDNPEDTILIHYAMKNYLLSIDKACKKPSHIKSFLPNIENLEINIELLKRIIKHNYLSEFLVSLKSRKEIIQEQLELINIIKIYDKNYDIDNELKNKFDDEKFKLEEDPYETIRQLTAIKGAVSGMISSYIEHYAKGHMIENIKKGSSSEAEAQIDNLLEIIKVYGK